MKRFFNFNSLTLFVTVISVIVPVWIWRADIDSRSLQVRIASQVSLQPDTAETISGLQVSVDGLPLKSPYLSVLELSNDGEKPILSADFEAPLEILITDGAVVARAQLTETKPKDIAASLSWESQAVKLKPLLLNPNDVVTILVLTSGKKPEFAARARIAGISTVSVNENSGASSRIQKAGLFLFAAMLLFIASDITNGGLISNEPILLRKRAAIIVSMTTGACGAGALIAFLNTIQVTDISLIAIAFIIMIFASIVISVYLNWNVRQIHRK